GSCSFLPVFAKPGKPAEARLASSIFHPTRSMATGSVAKNMERQGHVWNSLFHVPGPPLYVAISPSPICRTTFSRMGRSETMVGMNTSHQLTPALECVRHTLLHMPW